jgi:hypothetical protein
VRKRFRERGGELWALIAAVGEELLQEGNSPNNVAMTRMPPSRSWMSAA